MTNFKYRTFLKFTPIAVVGLVIGSCALHKFHKQILHENREFVYLDTELDTSLLFGIWTIDPEGPHADFWLSDQFFYLVDYDSDGDKPYFLKNNKITINFY